MEPSLTKMVETKRIKGPLILYGQDKKHLELAAKEFIQSVFMLSPNETTLNKLTQESHPDVSHIYPEGKSQLHTMSSMRELIQSAALPPFESAYKFFVIHDSERMLLSHANSLLKTLEEPESFAIFILLTTSLSDILPTILSRCQEIYIKAQNKTFSSYDILPTIHAAVSKNYSSVIKHLSALPDDVDAEEILSSIGNWFRDLELLSVNGNLDEIYYKEDLDNLKKCLDHNMPSLERVLDLLNLAQKGLDRHIKLKTCLERALFAL